MPDTNAPEQQLPETILVHRCDAEAIAHILFRLEDALRHGDEQIARDLSDCMTTTSLEQTADWVAELACYLERQLTTTNALQRSKLRP